MKIPRARLPVAAFTVYTFWYLILSFADFCVRGYGAGLILTGYVFSIAAVALGVAGGLYATLGVQALMMHERLRELRAGHAHRGARLSLGKLPGGRAGSALRMPGAGAGSQPSTNGR